VHTVAEPNNRPFNNVVEVSEGRANDIQIPPQIIVSCAENFKLILLPVSLLHM